MNRIKIKSCKDDIYTEGIGRNCSCKRVTVEITIARNNQEELDRLTESVILNALSDGLWKYTSKNKQMLNDDIQKWNEWAENGGNTPLLSLTPQQANYLLINK